MTGWRRLTAGDVVRPVQLSLEGFACFAVRQEVDFRGLTLFAISGATGAGKSSLLDALVFALYGRVPRLGHVHKDIITLGRDRMAVCLEFEAQGRTWRVSRTARRARAGDAVLEDVTGPEAPRTVASGADAVGEHIGALLGLPCEAFLQAVLLPQGEFARFLGSSGRERRAILRDLVGVGQFEAMRQAAERRRAAAAAPAVQLQARLEGDLGGATPETAAAAAARVTALAGQVAAASAEVEQLQAAHEGLARARAAFEVLCAARATLRAAAEDAAAVLEAGRRLEGAARAEPCRGVLEADQRAAGACAAAEADLVTTEAELRALRAESARAEDALADVERDAQALPGLRARVAALDSLRGFLAARDRAWERLFGLRRERAAAQDALREAEAAQERAGLAATRAHAALETEQRALDPGDDPAAERERLDPLRGVVAELARTSGALAAAEGAREDARARHEQEAAQCQRAEEAARAGERAADEARTARDHLRAHAAAAALRATLVPGAACPVCGAAVGALRDADAAEPGDGAARAAEARCAEAVGRSDTLQQEAGLRRASLAAAGALLEERQQTVERTRAAVEALRARLEGRRPQEVEEAWAALEERVHRRAVARERVQAATRAHQDAAHARARADQEVEHVRERRDALARSEEDARAEHARATAEVARVTTRDDVEAERAEVAVRLEALAARERAAHEAAHRAAAVEQQAASRARTLAERVDLVRREAADARAAAEQAALRAGLASAHDALQALVSPETRQALEVRVRQHAEGLAVASARQADAVARGAREVSSDAVDQAARAVDAARARLQELLVQQGRAEAEAREAASRAARAGALHGELATARAEASVHAVLAEDLRSDRFQAYVLRETFEALVAGASLRLGTLTGRYGLALEDDEFLVVDHDHAGERRPASTLSGGETFLASLALALELSQQVQRARGATALDSLFIDEGFGTLDPEMLDQATQALEALQSSGRMVGVVSHLPEMCARLPARLHVERTADGARVTREVD
ncbi:MAG: SMC family ATPase [Deltaproteobacteria bacterium]|nr:SMC family ATPase [Deltaproteobacteria bacterium]